MTADQELRLEWLPPGAGALVGSAFDEEINRLSDALRRRTSISTMPREEENGPSFERRVASWIAQADEGLKRLRKHRGDRLNRQFYDETEGGGGDAQRRHRR
jgi:hypothetical protein